MLRQRDFLVVTMSANCGTGLELLDEPDSVSDRASRPAAAISIIAKACAPLADNSSTSDNFSDDDIFELALELIDKRRSKSVVLG